MRPGISSAILLMIVSAPAQAISIQFDYSYDGGFFDDQSRRDLLQQAAGFYSSFTDKLLAISAGENDQWSVQFNNPSNVGTQVQQHNLAVSTDTITVYVGGSAMGSGVLGFGTNGTVFNVSGSNQFVDSIYTRGQENATGATATDFGTWGGAISFNSDVNWFWGETIDGLDASYNDFLTTATHELGHVLGYGTADSWFNLIEDELFSGAASVAAYGGLVPVVGSAHWAEGVMSTYNGMDQEAMMDPSTPGGVRQLPTVLDYAGFEDIGWQVAAVPLPGAFWLMLSGAGALFGVRGLKVTANKSRLAT